MPLSRIVACVLIAILSNILPAFSSPPDKKVVPPTRYEKLYNEFVKMSIDPSRGADIRNISIVREAATFNFGEGKLYICNPVGGFSCAAAFVGKGTFDFSPTLEVEQDQLYRFYEKKSLHEEFDFVLMIFADTTLRELYRKCKFGAMAPDRRCEQKIKQCLDFLDEYDGANFNPEIMKTFLEFQSNGLFYSQIESKSEGTLFFEKNPFAEEEVLLMRKNQGGMFGLRAEVISQFHGKACYDLGTLDHTSNKYPIAVQKNTINSTIENDLDFSANSRLEILSMQDNLQWCYLHLYHRLTVDSVVAMDRSRVQFFRTGAGLLWINFEPPLRANQTSSLQIYYHGDLLKRSEVVGGILIRSPDVWFPRTFSNAKSLFDLTFHTPSQYVFVAVGDRLASDTTDDVATSRWVTRKPIHNASFNIGTFNEHHIDDPSIPPVTVLSSRNSRLKENVGIDMQGSLQFCQAMFGKCTSDRLYATEIPAMHGEAFPGLIHLSWVTFKGEEGDGDEEIFRAHEVAHQWWGIGVGWKSYHDRWLSEGFAEYSGLWYMQASLKDNEKFFDVLRDWKDEIINNRKFLLSDGQESGPIWLGNRTATSTTSEDYSLIIYKKGAWVLHMLRGMLIDLRTMNEDKFKNIMKKFYTTYVDSVASTEDFQETIERELNIDFGWFFKQWVYGARIPRYTFAYKTEPASDGKYKVTCQVHQSNVADDFQMPVPLYVDFGDNKFVRLRAIVKGPVSTFELPLLPMKPEKIVFNDLEGVLCEVEDVSWSDR